MRSRKTHFSLRGLGRPLKPLSEGFKRDFPDLCVLLQNSGTWGKCSLYKSLWIMDLPPSPEGLLEKNTRQVPVLTLSGTLKKGEWSS